MSVFDAGEARARYSIDFSTFDRGAEQALRRWRELAEAQARAQRSAPGATPSAAPGRRPDNTALNARAERSALAYAQAEARLAAAQGDSARAATILRGALSAVTDETRQTLAARTQLANLERRAAADTEQAAGALRGLGRAAAGLGSALGAAGIAFGIAELAAFAVQAGRSAIQLERTEATIRQLAGSQARYNEVLELAEANQRIFGGSLNDNLVPLNSFLQLSNRAGASLETLNRLSQLLVASAPGRTFDDASFSLSEFLTQNGAEAALSLADRFNLPKSALAELATAGSSAAERLAGVERVLASQGVTADTLAASLTENADAYGRLGAQGSEAINRIGLAAANQARPVADFFAGVFENFNRIAGAGEDAAALAPSIFGQAGSYEEYAAAVGFVNDQLTIGRVRLGEYGADLVVGGQLLDALTRGQYDFAESIAATGVAREEAERLAAGLSNAQIDFAEGLIEQGAAAAQATERARELATVIDAVNVTQGRLFDDTGASSDQLRELGDTMLAVAGRTDEARAEVERLAGEYNNGRISSNDLEDAVLALADAQDRAAVQSEIRAAADRALEDQARATARALLDAGEDGEAAAERLAASGDRVDQLTAKYLRLGLAADAALGRGAAADGLARLGRGVDDAPTSGGKSQGESVLDTFRREAAAERAEEEKRERERAARAGRSASARKSEAERLAEQQQRENERRLEEQRRANERIEDETRDHYRELTRAAEDFATEATRDQEDYQLERQRLLAEGRVFEAEQLRREFERDQARARQDRDREVQREREDYATNISEIASAAGLAGAPAALGAVPVTLPGLPAQPGAAGGAVGAAGLRIPVDVRVQIDPTIVQVGEAALVEVIWPEVRQTIEAEAALGRLALDVGVGSGQALGVGGPRP